MQNEKASNSKHWGNLWHNRKESLRKIGIEENEDSQINGPVNLKINNVIEEIISNLQKVMPIKTQKACQTPKWLDKKKKLVLSPNSQNIKCSKHRENLKAEREKRSSNI